MFPVISRFVQRPNLESPVPGMDKLLEVESILQAAADAGEPPLSLAELKRRMHVTVRHKTVRDCLDVLAFFRRCLETDAGVQYVAAAEPDVEWVRLA